MTISGIITFIIIAVLVVAAIITAISVSVVKKHQQQIANATQQENQQIEQKELPVAEQKDLNHGFPEVSLPESDNTELALIHVAEGTTSTEENSISEQTTDNNENQPMEDSIINEPQEASQTDTSDDQHDQAIQQIEAPESRESRSIRLRARLAHTNNLFGKTLFKILSRDILSDDDWDEVEDTLLIADVGADTSEQIIDELKKDARIQGQKDPDQIRALLREKLLQAVGPQMDRSLHLTSNTENSEEKKPSIIMMVGVNGTGKTTTAGKLSRLLIADGKKVMMAAADTFRAAAADQLETWAKPVGITVVRSDKDAADPASVAYDGVQQAIQEKADVLLIDTAGRLQNKQNLMDELGKIRRVVEKTAPVSEVLLVLDATTGQNGMTQANVFAEAIGITGIVLTKLDGSAKGGIVISVQNKLGVPVKLVGLGEGPDDLETFDPASFVDGILGE